jgi:hypothetical protein
MLTGRTSRFDSGDLPIVSIGRPLLKSEIAQRWVIIGTAAKRPVTPALAFLNRKIVDAGNAQAHQAVLIELPILVAVAAKPIATVVVPLVGETNRDAVFAESPD